MGSGRRWAGGVGTASVAGCRRRGARAGSGALNFEWLSDYGVQVLLVTDVETLARMRLIWERLKIVVEPSSAVALAAILRHRDRFAGLRVGVILTGGNVDLGHLPW